MAKMKRKTASKLSGKVIIRKLIGKGVVEPSRHLRMKKARIV